jgi:glutamate racemase
VGGEYIGMERRRIPTIHADGFDDFFLVNGILRCTGFVLVKSAFERKEPERQTVVHMRISLAGAAEAQLEVQRLLELQSGEGFRFMRSEAAH